ncbi:hypothetical protein CRM22_000388 [Opisthorchis felineus]|uniref:RNA helicase n=1 Tax=Opisthorchis felineus TaxID=147828 RepID=A0A4S2MK16_OPIFE|nr:hypothetical protein CRM22_000388 [Opisthorchis felineus]
MRASNSSCPSSSIPSPKIRESLAEYRKRLPIWKHRETLIETIQSAQHCIIVSSTGSGKTTQIPQFLLEKNLLSNGVVAITQPRRVAAIGVACRVAEELGRGAVGTGPVGYCVRFEDASDPRTTRIRYMTDGMLLREAILDPDLSRYHYVILDEAHERSLNTDVLFGVVLTSAHRRARAQALSRNSLASATSGLLSSDNRKADSPLVQRKPLLPLLKIIIMSATIDPTPFVNFLGAEHTRVVYIEGRPHAIKVLNVSDSITDYVADAAIACIQIHKSKTCPLNRGILIFLTGEEEIMRCCALIHQLARRLGQNGKTGPSTNGSDRTPELLVFPLFAALPQGKQMQALTFSKSDCRKVIVSTNLAETSITIPGIRYVIDSGYAKIKFWDCTTGLETFRVQRISKSQAWQRAGRAGREAPGVCLRLYTDTEYKEMSLHIQPELLRAPLAGVLLNLISMNHKVPQKFPWISRPKEASLTAGVQLLERLGAVSPVDESSPSITNSVDSSGHSFPLTRQLQLTPLGSIMSAFPLDPRFSRTVLSAAYLGCLIEVLSVISMLYVSPVFYVPVEKREQFGETQERFRHPDGDLASLLQVYRGYVKSSKRRDPADASNTQPSRLTWCRSNFLNRARLETAVRVRSQLKQVAKGAGLTCFLRSCGSELFTITRAFLQAGFKDQVALLADPGTHIPHGNGVSSVLGTNSRQSVYLLSNPSTSQPTTPTCYFLIHPESQLYLPALSSPPPMVMFIETVTQTNSVVSLSNAKQPVPVTVYMRHVAAVPPGTLCSADDVNFNSWVSLIPSGRTPSSNKLKRRGDDSNKTKGKPDIVEPNNAKRPCLQELRKPNIPLGRLTKRQRKRLVKRKHKLLTAVNTT